MSDDAPISPVDAVRGDAELAPLPPTRPTPVALPDGVGTAPAPATLGDGATHEQLEHPVRPPAGVEARAGIHDAAEHGNPIAAAIERAHTADPTDRAQQLGGAAASAASGQSARIDRSRDDEVEGHGALDVDPLAPVVPVHDDGTSRGR